MICSSVCVCGASKEANDGKGKELELDRIGSDRIGGANSFVTSSVVCVETMMRAN